MLKLYSIYIDRFSNNGHNKISSGSGDTTDITYLRIVDESSQSVK